MASFDMVSKLDMGELKNAIEQAKKELGSRYDFKGSNTTLEITKNDSEIEIISADDYKVNAARDILYSKMGKRGLGLKGLEPSELIPTGNQRVKQTFAIHAGINKDQGKIINKAIKESKLKVSSQYLDEKIRVTGKKIDDLQEAYAFIKQHKEVIVDVQMENMKK